MNENFLSTIDNAGVELHEDTPPVLSKRCNYGWDLSLYVLIA